MVNSIRKTLKVCAVKAPGFGDRRKAMLQDMAILTGGELVAPELGYKLDRSASRCSAPPGASWSTKETTTIVDGGGQQAEVAARVAQIRKEIEASDSDWDKEKLDERLAKLSGGIAVIKVGAATEVEMKERKHRIEDAIAATKAAVEEGIVPGGGAALAQIASVLDDDLGLTGDEAVGVSIVRKALDRAAALDRPERRPRRLRRRGARSREPSGATASTRPPASTSTWPRPASSTR